MKIDRLVLAGLVQRAARIMDLLMHSENSEIHAHVTLLRTEDIVFARYGDRLLVATDEVCAIQRDDLVGVYVLPANEFETHVKPLALEHGSPSAWPVDVVDLVAKVAYESYGQFSAGWQQTMESQ